MTSLPQNIIHTDRSRVQAYQRCKRLRYWGYHGGSEQRGITPVKLSIHLVIGLAAHAGLATLLRESQKWLTDYAADLETLFVTSHGCADGKTVARQIEDQAVADALAELSSNTAHGVELDYQEQPDPAGQASINVANTGAGMADTPIQIDFSDFSDPVPVNDATGSTVLDDAALAVIEVANTRRAQGVDEYLLSELAVLVEGMVRAYARRRLRPLLDQFEVLEVEREGEWKLVDLPDRLVSQDEYERRQLNFMSRHDALLLERQSQQLYLLSYKTTGSWDRRKAADAQTDMQGLSEAVDVENRLAHDWQLVNSGGSGANEQRRYAVEQSGGKAWYDFLASQPAPPRILGVRYEYLNKGARRKDDKDPEQPGRYTFDSPLVRAYRQDGITADDRKWATHYNWWDEFGKKSTINYRSWQKSAVWRYMTSAQWIDLLDSGQVQPGACTEEGEMMDTLAEQFILPITVYRNEDDMRDMLEQLEAQEVKVAQDVATVAAAEDEGQRRSLLNQLFPQSRQACSYPGRCEMHDICYGGQDIRQAPELSGLYTIRVPNHPQETANENA